MIFVSATDEVDSCINKFRATDYSIFVCIQSIEALPSTLYVSRNALNVDNPLVVRNDPVAISINNVKKFISQKGWVISYVTKTKAMRYE